MFTRQPGFAASRPLWPAPLKYWFHEKNPWFALLDMRKRPTFTPVLPMKASPLRFALTPTMLPGSPVHPPTSSGPAGVAAPMPILPADSVITEFTTFTPPTSNFAIVSTVPTAAVGSESVS